MHTHLKLSDADRFQLLEAAVHLESLGDRYHQETGEYPTDVMNLADKLEGVVARSMDD